MIKTGPKSDGTDITQYKSKERLKVNARNTKKSASHTTKQNFQQWRNREKDKKLAMDCTISYTVRKKEGSEVGIVLHGIKCLSDF
jgi:hypothetical protein